MLWKAADSSLQPGYTGSGSAVSFPQSFFLPKEFRQTRDQFPRQTSKLCLSHLAHTLFFWRGWRWWAAKIQAPRGANYHIEEICLVFQEDNVRHEVHTGCHTHNGWRTHKQAGWRRHKCTSWCSRKVCKHVCIRTNTQNMMPSHIQSHKWVIICTSTEKRENPRSPNNLLGSGCTSTCRGSPPHINCFACKSTENGIISGAHPKRGSVQVGQRSQGQDFDFNHFARATGVFPLSADVLITKILQGDWSEVMYSHIHTLNYHN